jgi:transposase
MKRSQQRMPMTLDRQAYPSDLTDEQWELLEPLVPALSAEAAYHVHERREVVNAILYGLRSGCPWRLLPHEFPAWGTVYDYFRKWQREGIWDQLLHTLRRQVRSKHGRDEERSRGDHRQPIAQNQCGARSRKRLRYGEKKSGAGNATRWLKSLAICWRSR